MKYLIYLPSSTIIQYYLSHNGGYTIDLEEIYKDNENIKTEEDVINWVISVASIYPFFCKRYNIFPSPKPEDFEVVEHD